MFRFATYLIITAVLPLILLAMLRSAAEAESYVAGQLGMTVPQALSSIDLTQAGGPSGTLSDLDLNKSFLYGAKLGHYFEGTPWLKDKFGGKSWLGVETEIFNTTPHIGQQSQTSSFVSTPTVSPGATLRVLTWAMNVVARYPGERWQPYVGIGLGIYFAHLSDKSVGESQSSTTPGLNTQLGIRYILNKQLSVFGEWKFNYTRFKFDETPLLFGMDATYSAHNLVVGVAYHF